MEIIILNVLALVLLAPIPSVKYVEKDRRKNEKWNLGHMLKERPHLQTERDKQQVQSTCYSNEVVHKGV